MSENTVLARQEKLLLEIDQESTRAQVLRSVVDFRKSWLSLGMMLTNVAYGGDYKEWGYDDFEVYCARELGLKKQTAKKLMISYAYMKKELPSLIMGTDGENKPIPEYQTVAALADLEKCKNIDEEELQEVKADVLGGEIDDKEVRKKIRELKKEPSLPGMKDERDFQQLLIVSRKARRLVKSVTRLPDSLSKKVDAALAEVEALC